VVNLKILRLLPALLLAACLTFCNWPKDPEHTTERVRDRGYIHAGITHNPPFAIVTERDTAGLEVELLEQFADSLGVGIHWQERAEHELLNDLEQFRLDVVLGGLEKKAPSVKKVGLTTPYLRVREPKKKKYVLAVPPGENRWLVTLEEYIRGVRPRLERQYKTQPQ
jgi:ABC-type amino acid transport substrate-binding protein